MNRGRLEHLKTVLAAVPEGKLNMSVWNSDAGCGTVACALGWAALDPKFRDEGLVLFFEMPSYNNHSGFTAAEAFFELGSMEALDLFSHLGYPTASLPIQPADVIAKIDKLLA